VRIYCSLILRHSLRRVVKQGYNYGEVLGLSILFYEAQRTGRLPANNRIPFRGDSMLDDKGSNGEDLTGGYFDGTIQYTI
jgi:endoglucanase